MTLAVVVTPSPVRVVLTTVAEHVLGLQHRFDRLDGCQTRSNMALEVEEIDQAQHPSEEIKWEEVGEVLVTTAVTTEVAKMVLSPEQDQQPWCFLRPHRRSVSCSNAPHRVTRSNSSRTEGAAAAVVEASTKRNHRSSNLDSVLQVHRSLERAWRSSCKQKQWMLALVPRCSKGKLPLCHQMIKKIIDWRK